MKASVILSTYSSDMYAHFTEAAESVLGQSYENIELIVIVDGNDDLFDRISGNFGDYDDVNVHGNETNRGLSYNRNKGAELANGDIIVFMDDDAVADERWIEELVSSYGRFDARAVGGKMVPRWVDGRPDFFPEEFYWLVGVTYRGFPEDETEVRNTFSSNLSFRRDVFLELGGFREHLGKHGQNNLQGAETELCSRLREEFGEGVIYNPDAIVEHKVFGFRTDPIWMVKRAFWQGYSKRMMQAETPESINREFGFLRQLIFRFIPQRIGNLIRSPSKTNLLQLGMLLVLLWAVGIGFGYAVITPGT